MLAIADWFTSQWFWEQALRGVSAAIAASAIAGIVILLRRLRAVRVRPERRKLWVRAIWFVLWDAYTLLTMLMSGWTMQHAWPSPVAWVKGLAWANLGMLVIWRMIAVANIEHNQRLRVLVDAPTEVDATRESPVFVFGLRRPGVRHTMVFFYSTLARYVFSATLAVFWIAMYFVVVR